jgi:hypothetical protein
LSWRLASALRASGAWRRACFASSNAFFWASSALRASSAWSRACFASTNAFKVFEQNALGAKVPAKRAKKIRDRLFIKKTPYQNKDCVLIYCLFKIKKCLSDCF